MFASSLGFRIVVNLISRGGGEEKTLKNFLSFFSCPAGFHFHSLFFYSVKTHCKICIGLKVQKKIVTDDTFSELKARLDAVQTLWTSCVITFNPGWPVGQGLMNLGVHRLRRRRLVLSTGEMVFLANTTGHRIAFTSYEQNMQSV